MSLQHLKACALVIVGPLGCYAAYYLIFIGRYVGPSYPALWQFYMPAGPFIDLAAFIVCAAISLWASCKMGRFDMFEASAPNLRPVWYAAICAAIAALIWLSIYRVLGPVTPAEFIDQYIDYQFNATNGGAWMILGCYAALYLMLIDMHFGGVKRYTGGFFLLAILLTSVSGGRTILIIFVLVFLVLLMLQRVGARAFLGTAALAIMVIGSSYLLVSDLRAPAETGGAVESQVDTPDLAPEDSYDDLNYNAAFILNDTISAIASGRMTPQNHVWQDALMRLVPRQLMPEKPKSSSETIALYPHVANRGSNITFPLKANLLSHFGIHAFYADWVIVLALQLMMLAGVRQRGMKPKLSGFFFIFSGCAFILIARGGLFNARLMDQGICLLLAYAAYVFLSYILRPGGHGFNVASR